MKSVRDMDRPAQAAEAADTATSLLHSCRQVFQLRGSACQALVAFLVALASTGAAAKYPDLGFEDAFPTKIYEKSWFSASVTATSIVAAGAFSYVTAGTGAPAAATGVSSVATLVGGGGPGAYMAGLATVGGWFGGNALVGAAVLNGISLGTVGGTASLAKMSAFERAFVASIVSAHAIDGVSASFRSGPVALSAKVALPVPSGLASKGEVKSLAAAYGEINKKLYDRLNDAEKVRDEARRGSVSDDKKAALSKLERELKGLEAQRNELDIQIKDRARSSLKKGEDTAGNMLVLAVLAYNLKEVELFRTLLRKIDPQQVGRASYFSYLQAIAAIGRGSDGEAEKFLHDAITGAPFAVEPVILLVNVLASTGYRLKRAEIDRSTESAKFDGDKYRSPFNLVSLRYSVGTIALRNRDCRNALRHLRGANKGLGWIKKHVMDTPLERLIDVSIANAMRCIADDVKQGRYLTHPDLEEYIVEQPTSDSQVTTAIGKELHDKLCLGKSPSECRTDLQTAWQNAALETLTRGIQGSKGNERQTLCAHYAGPCS